MTEFIETINRHDIAIAVVFLALGGLFVAAWMQTVNRRVSEIERVTQAWKIDALKFRVLKLERATSENTDSLYRISRRLWKLDRDNSQD